MTNISSGRNILEEATTWVVRAHAGDLDDAMLLALTLWLEASPEHVEAYDKAEAAWFDLGDMAPVSAPQIDDQPETVTNIIDWEAYRTKQSLKRTVWPWKQAIAAGLLIALGLPAYQFWAFGQMHQAATGFGEAKSLTLLDGTIVALNTNTSLRYAVGAKSRAILLDHGEIALSVVHDPKRLFEVRSGGQKIIDVGTAFNVLSHDGKLVVTVKEGSVALRSTKNQQGPSDKTLNPGDQATIVATTGVTKVAKVDVNQAFAWRSGQLVYSDQTLGEIASDLNRYFPKPLEISQGARRIKISAVIPISSQDKMVKQLEAFAPVRAVYTHDKIRIEAN
jgi:transmembrane sensor